MYIVNIYIYIFIYTYNIYICVCVCPCFLSSKHWDMESLNAFLESSSGPSILTMKLSDLSGAQ